MIIMQCKGNIQFTTSFNFKTFKRPKKIFQSFPSFLPFFAVSVNTEIHQSPPKYTEIHHKASIYLPKYTHTSIVMV